jgi:hypothetical protein
VDKNVRDMTEAELRNWLITCDYVGKVSKIAALDELIRRVNESRQPIFTSERTSNKEALPV